MKVKMILPALTEATSPFWRPIKYSLFPPLGLATLAGYLGDDDEVDIQDEHVETLDLDDTPDLVVIQVYITSAYRAYRLADHYRRRGAHVALGGLHVTSLPEEAAPHADTIFLGPGEDTWPRFLADFRRGCPASRVSIGNPNARRHPADPARSDQAASLSRSELHRRVARVPARLRLLLQGGVLRRRPVLLHADRRCRARRDRASAGRHLYFLDDHLFGAPGSPRRCSTACAGWGGSGRRRAPSTRCWRPVFSSEPSSPAFAACSSDSRRSTPRTCWSSGSIRTCAATTPRRFAVCTTSGVMINGSFVFGMDGDDGSVFERTVEWAIEQGIETATFHILTPYPGTALYGRHGGAGPDHDSRLGSVRHAPRGLPPGADVGRTSSSRDTGAPIAISIDGDRSSAERRRTRMSRPGCAIWRTRQAGRSSSRAGISSSARNARG